MHARFEHATEDQLESYSLGILSERDVEILEEHLLICQQCQDRLTESDVFVQHMRIAAAKLRAGASRKKPAFSWSAIGLRRWPAPVWLAAAAVFCLIGVFWITSARKAPPPTAVLLQAFRGPQDAAEARAPKGQPVRLEADLTGLEAAQTLRMEVVDSGGRRVLEADATPQAGRVAILLKSGLGAGVYWVRLYGAAPGHQLLREYALRAQ
jgi:hypothetical protein